MRLVKRESNGIIHVALNRREMVLKEQIGDMLWCYGMKWNVSDQAFRGEPPLGYFHMKNEVMEDINTYMMNYHMIDYESMRSDNFDFRELISDGMYVLHVFNGEKWHYAGTYNTDWYEQYFMDNTNILERRGQ